MQLSRAQVSSYILLCILIFSALGTFAIEEETAEQLRGELRYDVTRRKAYKNQDQGDKAFDREREKGLALFLEEQEKWDLARERGIREYKKNKVLNRELDENSPEYKEDMKLKMEAVKELETARKKHVTTKKQILAEFDGQVQTTEEQELAIFESRPRYDLRKRARNKWVKSGDRKTISSGSSAGGAPPPPVYDDFPPPTDYAPPQPMDSFEEIPPPPPAMPYDGSSGGYDTGFGDTPMPPPPPPPPEGWDF